MIIIDKILYVNGINLVGLYSKTPIKCSPSKKYSSLTDYYDNSGNFSVDPNNLDINIDGRISFASENEHDIVMWTKGALAVLTMLSRWSK